MSSLDILSSVDESVQQPAADFSFVEYEASAPLGLRWRRIVLSFLTQNLEIWAADAMLSKPAR